MLSARDPYFQVSWECDPSTGRLYSGFQIHPVDEGHLADPCFPQPGKLVDRIVGISDIPGTHQTTMLAAVRPS